MIATGEPPSLAGKVVAITGSSRGIGRAVAVAMAEAGAKVVLNGRSKQDLSKAASKVAAAGEDPLAVRADASTAKGAGKILNRALKAHGRVDILINNAAEPGPPSRPAWRISERRWSETIASNLTGPFLCASVFLRWMVEHGVAGRVINVLSEGAAHGVAGLAPYSCSKAGLEMLTRCLALDAEGTGVVVSGVRLGAHRTEMTRRRLARDVVSGLAEPEAAAPLLLFAATGPAGKLRGRILSESRFLRDAEAEAWLGNPAAAVRPFSPHMPRYLSGTSRHAETRHLDFLENPCGPPPSSMAAMADAAVNLYPDPRLGHLRAALAERFALPPECFTFGPGSSEIVARILATYCREGDAVVASDPTWPLFERMSAARGLDLRFVPCAIDRRRRDARLGLDEVARAVDSRTRIVYLVDPHYPLGFGVDRAAFRRFLSDLAGGPVVVVDETYIDYADPARGKDTPDLVRQGLAPVIGVRSFSKFFGLAGIRLGFAMSTPEIAGHLARLEVTFGVGSIAEAAAVAALADEGHARLTRDTNRRGREQLRQGLAGLGLGALPSEANFVMAECPGAPEAVHAALADAGVHIPDVAWDGFIQLPIAEEADNERMIHALAEFRRDA